MKIKQLITGSLLGVALLTLVQSASAITLNIGDIYSIGLVYKGTPANAASVMGYINNLTPLAANSSTVIGGDTYTRTANTFSGLGQAFLTGYSDFGSAPTSVDLGTGYEYLSAHYGNYGQYIWNVTGLTGIITIQNPAPAANGGGLSTVYTFNGSGSSASVPDAGSTVLMLGVALSGLSLVSRRFKK